jgi:hypothetical protein
MSQVSTCRGASPDDRRGVPVVAHPRPLDNEPDGSEYLTPNTLVPPTSENSRHERSTGSLATGGESGYTTELESPENDTTGLDGLDARRTV